MASEAYTVSKMLQSINDVMAPVAATPTTTVSLKRRLDNGIMLDTSPREIALLDLQAKVKHAAQEVTAIHNSGGDKRQWLCDKRQAGNEAFNEGRFQQAAELYVEALTALDFGDSPEQRRVCERFEQVPLTCNLASCLLMLEQWEKARQVCGQALRVDPTCVRALSQRAKALTRLSCFDEARRDLQQAIDALEANANTLSRREPNSCTLEKLHQQAQSIDRAERRERVSVQQQRLFQRQMMREAVGRLYEDKETIEAKATTHPADAASRDVVVARGYQPTVQQRLVRWLASILLIVLRFLFGAPKAHE